MACQAEGTEDSLPDGGLAATHSVASTDDQAHQLRVTCDNGVSQHPGDTQPALGTADTNKRHGACGSFGSSNGLPVGVCGGKLLLPLTEMPQKCRRVLMLG